MTLGERIVHYRKRQGLSQEQLSQRLGVSRQSVSKWERDESLPETDKLPLLAKTLGVSLDALLSGEEEAPPQPAGPTPAKGGAVGKLVWLFRRWGWMGGLVLAAYGAATFGLGLLARFLMGPVFPPRELLLQAGARGRFGVSNHHRGRPGGGRAGRCWGNHRGGSPLPQAARREEVNPLLCKTRTFLL